MLSWVFCSDKGLRRTWRFINKGAIEDDLNDQDYKTAVEAIRDPWVYISLKSDDHIVDEWISGSWFSAGQGGNTSSSSNNTSSMGEMGGMGNQTMTNMTSNATELANSTVIAEAEIQDEEV